MGHDGGRACSGGKVEGRESAACFGERKVDVECQVVGPGLSRGGLEGAGCIVGSRLSGAHVP
jgi:hypothetical protein